jgi:hypothetical protein
MLFHKCPLALEMLACNEEKARQQVELTDLCRFIVHLRTREASVYQELRRVFRKVIMFPAWALFRSLFNCLAFTSLEDSACHQTRLHMSVTDTRSK